MSTEDPGADAEVAASDEDVERGDLDMSMFASVWVKVEVKEGDDEEEAVLPQVEEKPVLPQQRKKKKQHRSTKVLHCDLCDYTTTYKNCLDIHSVGHYNLRPFSCDWCDFNTKFPSGLYRHITMKHADKLAAQAGKTELQPFKCDNCDYTTNFRWNLNAHKRKHKLEKQYKCEQCPYETAYRHNFVKHSKVHKVKTNEVFKCDKCPFVTKYVGHIQRHLAKIHNEVMATANICEFCGFATRENWRLTIHKTRSKQETPIKCMFCDFQSEYMCESKKHKKSHYGEVNENNDVNYTQDELSAMLDSVRANSDPNALTNTDQIDVVNNLDLQDQCIQPESSHACSNNYTMDPNCVDWNSIQVLESDDRDRPFKCHLCEYTSKFKASVQRHFQRLHTGSKNKPYKCVNCDFSTKTKDQISLHNKRSQSQTCLYCNECKYSTFFKCQLIYHQKRHFTNKCSLCNYSSKQKYELTKHFAIYHLGTSMKCQYCDFRAGRKDTLLCHQAVHTGFKPHKCNFCDYSAIRKCLLDNHLRRFHGEVKNGDVTVVSESKIQSLKMQVCDESESKVAEDISV